MVQSKTSGQTKGQGKSPAKGQMEDARQVAKAKKNSAQDPIKEDDIQLDEANNYNE